MAPGPEREDDPVERAPAAAGRRYLVHLGLFALTCATTFVAGAELGGAFDARSGAQFAGTLMAILVCHEMGHYLVARRHGLDVSLPYFIPLPPFVSLGTMGAVIRMRQPIQDRNQLLDVGAAGPLAGLVAALPLLAIGLRLSPVEVSSQPGGLQEGNSLLYLLIKYAVHGRYLPAADGADVQLHPMAFAAWVGLLITMINLMPIGQLDGGHISAAALGPRHERLSRWLHRLLLAIGAVVAAALTAEGMHAGWTWTAAVRRAAWAALPWAVWAVLLLVMLRMGDGLYHPPVHGVPLSPRRRTFALGMLAVFVLLFTPVPLREALR
jgi:membrane-associated protease RseP (regulator of RpoE activity)